MATRFVVTGASGLLGRAVVAHLRRAGIAVTGVARSAVPDTLRVEHYCESPPADVLIHLAQESNRDLFNRSGQAGVDDGLRTLEALLSKPYQRVVYGSSGTLYGDGTTRACRPADPLLVQDSYNELKWQSELRALGSGRGVAARLGNVFGPGLSRASVLSRILQQIPGEGPLEVFDTSPVRDFLWIEDAAAALVSLADVAAGTVLNVGSGVGTSIGELARCALDCAGAAHRPVLATHPSARFSSIVLDISDTLARCAWAPQTSVRQGLCNLVGIKGRS